jgi:hypothetical protein
VLCLGLGTPSSTPWLLFGLPTFQTSPLEDSGQGSSLFQHGSHTCMLGQKHHLFTIQSTTNSYWNSSFLDSRSESRSLVRTENFTLVTLTLFKTLASACHRTLFGTFRSTPILVHEVEFKHRADGVRRAAITMQASHHDFQG